MRQGVMAEVRRGKAISRALINDAALGCSLRGVVLDVGGERPLASHYRFITLEPGSSLIIVNITSGTAPDLIADAEAGLAIRSSSCDSVVAMNLLEHTFSHGQVLAEMARVLRPGGAILVGVPFLVRVHGDPHDYFRYTETSLRMLLSTAGFEDITVTAAGRGPLTAAASVANGVLPRPLVATAFAVASALDRVIVRRRPALGPQTYPVAYLATATRGARQPG